MRAWTQGIKMGIKHAYITKVFVNVNPITLGIGKVLCQLLYDKLPHIILSLLADQLM